jgi:Uma2 family endonuclease
MDEVILKIPEHFPMTDDELFELCVANKELRIERDENGQLIIMSPAGSFSSNLNFNLNALFGQWVYANSELGYGFDSSGGFVLPDKSMRSPDVAWVKKSRWEGLTLREQKKFAPICPDFVIELRSESDSLTELKIKMEKWMRNGCQIAWLIDPTEKNAYIYKSGLSPQEIVGFDKKLSGEKLLPGFELDLSRLLK